MVDNDKIDTEHPIFDYFRAAGYPPEALTDPGNVSPEDIEEGGWQAAVWNNHGVERFDIPEGAVRHEDWSPSGVVVAMDDAKDTRRPIGFADESGPLNDDIPDMGNLRARASAKVSFFAGPDAEREYPEYTEEEAIEAIRYWGPEGFMPLGTANAIGEPFGLFFGDSDHRDDPDVEGGKIVRAPGVAKRVAGAAINQTWDSDPSISGHKKRRRQVMSRNITPLREEYGLDDD